MAISNGRLTNVPTPISGRDLIKKIGQDPGRRAVIVQGMEAVRIEETRVYAESELYDKRGKLVNIVTIPERVKGSPLFWGPRSFASKKLISAQVRDIEAKCFHYVAFDAEGANWMVVHRYKLPHIWHEIATFSSLMVVFPTEYPLIPPIGFYLHADLPGAPDGRLHERVYHDAAKEPLEKGYKWYCVYVQPGSWQPQPLRYPDDWRRGDNIWTYFTLIKEALSSAA